MVEIGFNNSSVLTASNAWAPFNQLQSFSQVYFWCLLYLTGFMWFPAQHSAFIVKLFFFVATLLSENKGCLQYPGTMSRPTYLWNVQSWGKRLSLLFFLLSNMFLYYSLNLLTRMRCLIITNERFFTAQEITTMVG